MSSSADFVVRVLTQNYHLNGVNTRTVRSPLRCTTQQRYWRYIRLMKRLLLTLLPLVAAAQTPPTNVLTPEKLWQLGRLGEMQVSPDGKSVAYTVTKYNLSENKSGPCP